MALTIQQTIQVYYSGDIDHSSAYFNLIFEAGAVLVAGIVLWRLSLIFFRKKQVRQQGNTHFETRYSKEWRNR